LLPKLPETIVPSNVTLVRPVQLRNALAPIDITLSGMVMKGLITDEMLSGS